MSKTLTLLVSSALLVLTLTACGWNQKDNNANIDNTPETNNGTSDGIIAGDNGTANNGTTDNGLIENDRNNTNGTAEKPGDALTGTGNDNLTDSTVKQNAHTGDVTYGQMLRNGRVHDRDGDLTDHENAVTPHTTRSYF